MFTTCVSLGPKGDTTLLQGPADLLASIVTQLAQSANSPFITTHSRQKRFFFPFAGSYLGAVQGWKSGADLSLKYFVVPTPVHG